LIQLHWHFLSIWTWQPWVLPRYW